MKDSSPGTTDEGAPLPGMCFCGNLRRATRTVTRVYEEEFRAVGFTGSTQYNVLRTLSRADAVCQRDLGKALGVDETTLTRTLKPLVEKGWIALAEGSDRREKRVSLTKGGHRQIERATPAWRRAQERIRRTLPPGLWDSLMEALPLVAKAGEAA